MSLVIPGSAAFVKGFINVVCVVRKVQNAWNVIPPQMRPLVKGLTVLFFLFVGFLSKKIRQSVQDGKDRASKLRMITLLVAWLCLVTIGAGVYLFSVPVEPEPTMDNTRIMWSVVLLYSLGMNYYFR